MWAGRDVKNTLGLTHRFLMWTWYGFRVHSGMWRVYLQNSRDVGSTLLRARRRVVKTGSGLISSAGAANVADGF